MFDQQMQLSGWKNVKTGKEKISRRVTPLRDFAFNGIHIIQPEIFKLLPAPGKFSIIPAYLDLAINRKISGYTDPEAGFVDIGRPENLQEAERFVKEIRS